MGWRKLPHFIFPFRFSLFANTTFKFHSESKITGQAFKWNYM